MINTLYSLNIYDYLVTSTIYREGTMKYYVDTFSVNELLVISLNNSSKSMQYT